MTLLVLAARREGVLSACTGRFVDVLRANGRDASRFHETFETLDKWSTCADRASGRRTVRSIVTAPDGSRYCEVTTVGGEGSIEHDGGIQWLFPETDKPQRLRRITTRFSFVDSGNSELQALRAGVYFCFSYGSTDHGRVTKLFGGFHVSRRPTDTGYQLSWMLGGKRSVDIRPETWYIVTVRYDNYRAALTLSDDDGAVVCKMEPLSFEGGPVPKRLLLYNACSQFASRFSSIDVRYSDASEAELQQPWLSHG